MHRRKTGVVEDYTAMKALRSASMAQAEAVLWRRNPNSRLETYNPLVHARWFLPLPLRKQFHCGLLDCCNLQILLLRGCTIYNAVCVVYVHVVCTCTTSQDTPNHAYNCTSTTTLSSKAKLAYISSFAEYKYKLVFLYRAAKWHLTSNTICILDYFIAYGVAILAPCDAVLSRALSIQHSSCVLPVGSL